MKASYQIILMIPFCVGTLELRTNNHAVVCLQSHLIHKLPPKPLKHTQKRRITDPRGSQTNRSQNVFIQTVIIHR